MYELSEAAEAQGAKQGATGCFSCVSSPLGLALRDSD